MLRKQVKDLNAKLGDANKKLKCQQTTVDTFQVAGDAVDALKSELALKTKEKAELQFKVDKLTAEAEAHEYDAKRNKEERDKLMTHYEQQLKKKAEELMVEKRESAKIRQLIHGTPPPTGSRVSTTGSALANNTSLNSSLNNIKKSELQKEVIMLREEVEKKSELIKTLAANVKTPENKNNKTVQFQTPATNRKRKLYTNTPAAEVHLIRKFLDLMLNLWLLFSGFLTKR